MKKLVLLCILLSSFAMARFDCCARKRATVKKEETSLIFSVGVIRAEDETLLKKASTALAKESITLQVKKWDSREHANEALAKGFVDGLYIDSLRFNPDSEKKEVILRLKKEIGNFSP
jgi:ABC-type metal ion transport system substrate-binding protein